jgi:outer membrane protein TolC
MRFTSYTIISLLIIAYTTVSANGATPLTLDDCLEIALSTNPTIKVADMEITRMDYSRKETLGQLLPSISFGGTYNRTLAKQVTYMNLDAFGSMGGSDTDGESAETTAESSSKGGNDSGFKVGLDNSYSLGFSASMPLIAPQLWKTLNLSESRIIQAVEQARTSRLNLINQVKTAFYMLLLAQDSKDVIQESYDMAKLTYDIYSKKYQAGAASDYDVLRTSVAVKNVEPELLQADISIKQAKLQLLILMGVDVSFPLEIAGELKDYESSMYDRAMALGTDFTDNSDLRMNTIETRLLEDALKVQKMAWYPTLSLSTNYNWNSMSNGTPFKNFRWTPYSMIGLTLSVPLFEGGQRYHKQKQAEIQVEEMKWQRENLERTISTQVTLAHDNILMNVKQISSSSESVKQADKAHDIMEKSFAIGAASYLDLRDSELALTQARLTYYQSIYNFLIANNDLELLLGTADTKDK